MKKYLILLLIPLIFSCNSAEIDRLKQQNDSLQNLSNQKEGKVNDFIQAFNEIQSNLDEIKQKEQIISVQTNSDKPLDQNSKDKINQDILSIYEMMLKNKKAIASLNKKLKNSNVRLTEMEKTLAKLTEQMNKKDAELEQLKVALAQKDIDIVNLNQQIKEMNSQITEVKSDNNSKQEVIQAQDEQINTAFYAVGTKKELKENNVVQSDGIFKTKVGTDFNKGYFKKIDIRKLTTIPLNCKKATLLSTHPSDSYFLDGKGKVVGLVIKNPTKFWEASKYLVIVTD